MQLQGTHSFLNNHTQSSRTQSKKKSLDSFEDVLSKNQVDKKTKQDLKSEKVDSKRKDPNQDLAGSVENSTTSKPDNKSFEKQNENSNTIDNKKRQDQSFMKVVEKSENKAKNEVLESSESLNSKGIDQAIALTPEVNSIENAEMSTHSSIDLSEILKDSENPLSVKSSELDEKTLEGLDKILENIKNPDQSHLTQINTSNSMNVIGEKNLGNLKNFSNSSATSELSLASVEEGPSSSLLGSLNLKENSGEDKGFERDNTFDYDSFFVQHQGKNEKLSQGNNIFSQNLDQAIQGEKGSEVENMQSIIKQARTFVKDGGGSMEIHLQPEGLGKVHLKVAVDKGQVNVEMLADNHHAKKALEEGLYEIRHALEGQKLMVDTLKVEMSPDYQKDFSNFNQQMQEQANRDFAQQFLGQFQQEREGRISGMFDGFRGFQHNQAEPDLTLRARQNPYASQGKGRTINIVA